MKFIKLSISTLFIIPLLIACNPTDKKTEKAIVEEGIRHVVLFKLNDSTSNQALEEIKAFTAPLADIEVVKDFEFGTNNSPEGLDKGFSYSLVMQFANEYDRDSVYLPHPIHQEFVKNIQLHMTDVIVFDLDTNCP